MLTLAAAISLIWLTYQLVKEKNETAIGCLIAFGILVLISALITICSE